MVANSLGIVDSLARQAAISPNRDALRVSGTSVTYSSLHEDVTTLANYLSTFRDSFPSGSFLPLEVPQTVDSYVAVLAALAAGIPFSLVDPATPEIRRENVLHLLSAKRIVQIKDLHERQGLGDVFSGIVHHTSRGLVDSTGKQPILGLASSGTTGEPKIIALDQRAVSIRLVPDFLESDEGRGVRVSNTFSPIYFGGGFWRLGDILNGVTLQVMNLRESSLSGLVENLHAGGVDYFRLPSDVLRLLGTSSDQGRRFDQAKIVHVGIGQAVLAKDVSLVSPLFPRKTVVRHSLSATEVGEMFRWDGELDALDFENRIPIGLIRPGGEVQVQMRADFGPGTGEVLVSGERVALGYISHSTQSNRFTIGPDGTRTWFSGDIVKELGNGVHSHISRVDDAVKVLGRFVSPSEIDTAVRQFPGVSESLTIPMPDGSSRLETFVELEDFTSSTQQAIRHHLERVLPRHMIPTRLIILARIPRTNRGKIDRHYLQSL
jgi:fengycin family lipopeptide synthetase C